ncbi:MAG TPA: hypothetical protein VE263_12435 [Candidatus Angelobacter sp.]|nr:hypothetical protein [Candidatus Angelobacter sp.]
MLGEHLHHDSRVRLPKPLVVRGGLGRTFGSLVSFLALTLLACGGYLLEDLLAHPVDAYPAPLITAAFAIALSLLLFFYLFKPRRNGDVRIHHSHSRAHRTDSSTQHLVSRRNSDARRDLAYQRIYVDHSRIRA